MNTPPPVISLSQHPTNIVVFKAASMKEAVLMADEAFKTPSIQGAIWHDPANTAPVQWKKEIDLRSAFEQAGEVSSLIGNYKIDCYRINSAGIYLNSFNQSVLKKVDTDILGKDRSRNLQALGDIFSSTKMSVHHITREQMARHYDGDTRKILQDPQRLFSGTLMRILQARQGPGTIIYEGSDPFLKQWQIASRDFLFFMGRDGIEAKALLHSAPEFDYILAGYTRVLDVYYARDIG